MKKSTLFLYLAVSCCMLISCDKKEVVETDVQLNKIVGTMNGKDTVMDISVIHITNFSKFRNSYLQNQELSVISATPSNGIQVDFYVSDTTTLKVNKKHYIVHPFHAMDLGVTIGYFHRYTSAGSFPQFSYATETGEDYYCTITELEGNVIRGEVKYKVDNVIFSGKFYSDKLEYKTSSN